MRDKQQQRGANKTTAGQQQDAGLTEPKKQIISDVDLSDYDGQEQLLV